MKQFCGSDKAFNFATFSALRFVDIPHVSNHTLFPRRRIATVPPSYKSAPTSLTSCSTLHSDWLLLLDKSPVQFNVLNFNVDEVFRALNDFNAATAAS